MPQFVSKFASKHRRWIIGFFLLMVCWVMACLFAKQAIKSKLNARGFEGGPSWVWVLPFSTHLQTLVVNKGHQLRFVASQVVVSNNIITLALQGEKAIKTLRLTQCNFEASHDAVLLSGQGSFSVSLKPNAMNADMKSFSVQTSNSKVTLDEIQFTTQGARTTFRSFRSHFSLPSNLDQLTEDIRSLKNFTSELKRLNAKKTPSLGPKAEPEPQTLSEKIARTQNLIQSLLGHGDFRLEGITLHALGQSLVDGGTLAVVQSSNQTWISAELNDVAQKPLLKGNLTLDQKMLHAQTRIEHFPMLAFVPLLPPLPWKKNTPTTLDGNISFKSEHESILTHLDLKASELAFSSSRLADSDIEHLQANLKGDLALAFNPSRLTFKETLLGIGTSQMRLRGEINWDNGLETYGADLQTEILPTPCQDLLHSIPPNLLDQVANIQMGGTFAMRNAVKFDSNHLDDLNLVIDVEDKCQFVSVPPSLHTAQFTGPFNLEIEEGDGTPFRMLTGPGTGKWTSIRSIHPFFIHAVLAHEDAGFFSHKGFARWAIKDALIANLKAKRFVRGASTISMQLVKNIFLHRKKTLARKLQEVILTWWVESSMDKVSMLELYLNVIEYGPNLYGIKAASEHYFGKHPSELTAAESLFLATLLPNPKSYHAQRDKGALWPSWIIKLKRFASIMKEKGRFDSAAFDDAMAQIDQFGFTTSPGHSLGTAMRQPVGNTSPLPWMLTDDTMPIGEYTWSLDSPSPEAMASDPEPALERY